MDGLIIWLMMINLISQSAFSVMAPFYPDIAIDDRGMSAFMVGMVMSSFSITFVITSLFVGHNLGKIGRRRAIYVGIVIQTFSMVGFGCVIWIYDRTMFMVASFVLRMIGGISCAFICVSAYAMTSIRYPDNVQAKISLLEAANGAGLFIGPIFGGAIYQLTSYCVPFFIFSAIFISFPLLMRKSFTEDLDRVDQNMTENPKISLLKLLGHRRVFFAALAQFFNIMTFTVGQPLFGPRLTNDYGFSNALVGVAFAIPTVFYIFTGLVILPFLTRVLKPRVCIMIGFCFLITSAFLIGPSQLLGMPETSAVLMIGGLCFMGFGAAWTVIPVIPEMLDSVKGQYVGQETEVSDGFSGIFNVAGGFGQIIGPTVAGLTADEVGFNWTFDGFALILVAFNVLYIL
jgi:MFS family permease